MIYTHAAVALAAAIAASAATWKVQAWRFDSERLAAAENVREVEKMRRQAANRGAAAHEADKIVIRKEFVPITQEVERVVTQVVYRDSVCLPDDGLQLLRAAISRANGDPGKSGDPLPASP